MPNQQAHINDFRKGGHKLFASLSVYKGALVLTGAITAVPAYPMKLLAYSITTGVHTDILPGARYEIWTPDGLRKKGTSRVRYNQTISSTSLPIRENSKGSIAIEIGDVLKVYRDVRLSDLLVEDNELFSPDGTPVSDLNSNPPPWANSGGAVAGSTKLLPFLMTGSTSFAVDPDSGGTVTHVWTLPTGLTFASGTSTSADPTITGTPGEYLVTHAATDSSNSKTTTQYIPVIIHGTGYAAHRVQVESLPDDESQGGSATVKMLGSASFADVPDGALAILWKEEYIAGVRQSFGARAPGRSHILYVGIIRRERGSLDADSGVESLSFELISPLARLEELMGYGKVMLNTATPDAWNEIRLLTVKRTILQLFQFYSNLNQAGYDLTFRPSFTDRNLDGAFINETTPLGQAREMAKSVQCRLIEDRRGSFSVAMRPELVALADRASDLETTLSMTFRDTKGWEYSREHWRSYNRLEVRGFAAGYGVEQPIFSEWVGRGAGEGNQTSIEEGAIVADQTELNAVAGRMGAALDGIYVDSDGALQMALDLTIPLRGVYDVFDFYDEVIELAGVTTKRGIDFGDQQYVLVSSDLDFGDGTATTTLRLRTCTNGAEGATFVPPAPDVVDYTNPFDEFPPNDYSYTSPVLGIGYDIARMALICANGLALTENFNYPAAAGGPIYVFYSWASLSVTGTMLGWVPRGGTSPAAGWLITSTKVYYLVLATQVADDKHTFAAATSKRSFDAAFREGSIHFVVSSYVDGTGGFICRTQDNTTFTEVANGINSPSDDSSFGTFPGCWVSTRTAGRVYTSRFTNDLAILTGAATSEGRQSADYGATTSALTLQSSGYMNQHIHVPWHDNGSEAIVYYGALVGASDGTVVDAQHLYRNATDISPTISGIKYGTRQRDAMCTSVQNRQRMLAVAQRSTAPDAYAFFLSNNAGGAAPTWTVIDPPGTTYRRCAISGDDPNTAWAWGISDTIYQLRINGAEVVQDDRRGNLASLSVGEIIALAGM